MVKLINGISDEQHFEPETHVYDGSTTYSKVIRLSHTAAEAYVKRVNKIYSDALKGGKASIDLVNLALHMSRDLVFEFGIHDLDGNQWNVSVSGWQSVENGRITSFHTDLAIRSGNLEIKLSYIDLLIMHPEGYTLINPFEAWRNAGREDMMRRLVKNF
jgi:hypothetical protein